MAVGSKQKYTAKQKRTAEQIEASYEEKGVSSKKAKQIAWATVNKQSGGGEHSGSGKATPEREKEAARKDSAQKAVETKKAKAEPDALENKSIRSLRGEARARCIDGRSSMNKAELILALRQSE